MDKFVSWFYSKDFTFWQNIGHLAVVIFLLVIVFGVFSK
jgi:hypothetical protein